MNKIVEIKSNLHFKVGYNDVVEISKFDYEGTCGYYPWYRVVFENGNIYEINSLYVEWIAYE